jgi:hypothetical protein
MECMQHVNDRKPIRNKQEKKIPIDNNNGYQFILLFCSNLIKINFNLIFRLAYELQLALTQ